MNDADLKEITYITPTHIWECDKGHENPDSCLLCMICGGDSALTQRIRNTEKISFHPEVFGHLVNECIETEQDPCFKKNT